MKLIVLMLLAGLALAAAAPSQFGNDKDEFSIENSESESSLEDEKDISLEEVQKRLKERFDEVLKKIKDAIDHGKFMKEDLLTKMEELRRKLKDLNVDVDDKGKEILQKLKDFWKKIWNKRSADIDVFDMLKQLKEAIKDHLDVDKWRELVKNLLEKRSEILDQLSSLLKDNSGKSKEKLLEFIERILGKKNRSIKETFEKVKNFFKDLNIELKEKFAKLGDYVKKHYEDMLEKGNTRVENVRRIARELLDDTKQLSKDVAAEALDFFREYKEDLGTVYDDLKEKLRDVLKKN